MPLESLQNTYPLMKYSLPKSGIFSTNIGNWKSWIRSFSFQNAQKLPNDYANPVCPVILWCIPLDSLSNVDIDTCKNHPSRPTIDGENPIYPRVKTKVVRWQLSFFSLTFASWFLGQAGKENKAVEGRTRFKQQQTTVVPTQHPFAAANLPLHLYTSLLHCTSNPGRLQYIDHSQFIVISYCFNVACKKMCPYYYLDR